MLHELQHLLFDRGDEKRKKEMEKMRKFTKKSLTPLVCQVLEFHKKKLDIFSLPSLLCISYNPSLQQSFFSTPCRIGTLFHEI